jgi:hypothetical protein
MKNLKLTISFIAIGVFTVAMAFGQAPIVPFSDLDPAEKQVFGDEAAYIDEYQKTAFERGQAVDQMFRAIQIKGDPQLQAEEDARIQKGITTTASPPMIEKPNVNIKSADNGTEPEIDPLNGNIQGPK